MTSRVDASRMPGTVRPRNFRTLREEIRSVCFEEGGYPHEWPVHKNCPCCNSRFIRQFFARHEIDHWLCGDCNFVFVNPYPPDKVIERLYNASFYPAVRRFAEAPRAMEGRADATASIDVESMQKVIDFVAGEKAAPHWLDVGGGIGVFVDQVRQQLPGATAYLNEMNLESLEIAKEIYDVNVINQTPDQMLEQGMSFDVISALAVLEHVPFPKSLIESYARLLKPGGLFVILIPQFSELSRRLLTTCAGTVCPPYHLSHFDASNFKAMLSSISDFDKVETWFTGDPALNLVAAIDLDPYWDISIPTEHGEQAGSVMLRPYPDKLAKLVNFVARISKEHEEEIREMDGGLLVTAVARRKAS